MSNSETVQEQIRRLRLELGISANKMSRELGRNGAYIWNVEAGKIKPALDALVEIAEWFAARGKHLQLVPRECVCSSKAS